jgi:hypothetical protein
MNIDLLEFARRFAAGDISADEFSDTFIDRWREEGEDDVYKAEHYELGGRLASIFCLADLYNPDSNRAPYELDESRLREEVRKLV